VWEYEGGGSSKAKRGEGGPGGHQGRKAPVGQNVERLGRKPGEVR